MKKNLKITKKELIINIFIALAVLGLALFTSFPYISSVGTFLHNFPAKSQSKLMFEHLGEDILPNFRYSRYQIELNEITPIDLLVKPGSKKIKVEVVGAEGIGLAIDSSELIQKGLKVIKPKRPRQKQSKKPLQDSEYTNNATYYLREIENKAQTIEAIDFEVYKILLKGILPGSYTLKATVDNNESATTTVTTKPGVRIDLISPNSIEAGAEAAFTIIGKGLDQFIEVLVEGNDVKVKDYIISSDDNTLKITLIADGNAEAGFRDVTIFCPLKGVSSVLVNALEVKSLTADIDVTTTVKGPQGEQGPQGIQGPPGSAGMSICESPADNLMVFTNTLSAGNNATAFFDPVQCNLIFGIPLGFNGINGNNGFDGMGVCNNLNSTLSISTTSLAEGAMATSDFDPAMCTLTLGVPKGDTGAQGATGATGLSGIDCWDLNGNRQNDSNEDINMDGVFNSYDCMDLQIKTIQEAIATWDTLSDEQNFTTASGDMTRMIKVPFFIYDGVIYGGFWIDKYEASRANATATTEGTSLVPASQRNVVPWANINLTSAKSYASSSSRQVSELGSCHLIGMREWYALYLLGRTGKQNNLFGATATSGWNERGNTRSGQDGRASSSYTCTDDPTENAGGAGRCLTGTGYKSWGHLLDPTATTSIKSGSGPGEGVLGGTADSVKDDDNETGADTFNGDLQIYDLVGNIDEWIDFTLTRASNITKIDPGYQASGQEIPYTTNNRYISFDDIASGTDTIYTDFQGLGLPFRGATATQTDLNGGANDGRFLTNNTNQQYGTARGGSWTSNTNSKSPIYLDISTTPTTTQTNRGFRVVCDFAN